MTREITRVSDSADRRDLINMLRGREESRMPPNITIRQMVLLDIYHLALAEHRINFEPGCLYNLSPNPVAPTRTLEIMFRTWRGTVAGTHITKVAHDEGAKRVGFCAIRPYPNESTTGIVSLWVLSDYRRMGIGRVLMKEALRSSIGRFDVAELYVHADNHGAKKLYTGMSFVHEYNINNVNKWECMSVGLRHKTQNSTHFGD